MHWEEHCNRPLSISGQTNLHNDFDYVTIPTSLSVMWYITSGCCSQAGSLAGLELGMYIPTK